MELLGDRIEKLRKQKHLTQEELGAFLGKNHAVSKWEKNIAKPDIETLVKIAAIFEVDLSYLVMGEKQESGFIAELHKRGINEKDLVNLSDDKKRLIFKLIEEIIYHVEK